MTARQFADACEGRLPAFAMAVSQVGALAGVAPKAWRSAVAIIRSPLPWLVATAALLVARAWDAGGRSPAGFYPTTGFTVPMGPDEQPADVQGARIAIAADGSRIVYVAQSPVGSQLVMRAIDRLGLQPLPGTQDASAPCLSTDGEWIAFFAEGKLKKMRLAGGPPTVTAEAPARRGCSWGEVGSLVYADQDLAGLQRVPASGGPPVPITRPDTAQGERGHRWPEVLPGSRTVVYTSWRGDLPDARLAVATLVDGKSRVFQEHGTNPQYVGAGYIVAAQSTGTVIALPFDASTLRIHGPPGVVATGVAVFSGGAANLAVSRSGTLAYVSDSAFESRLTVVDRIGRPTPLTLEHRQFRNSRISPDGRRIATEIVGEIWLYDTASSTLARFGERGGQRYGPAWSPDGKRIAYIKRRDSFSLYVQAADGSTSEEMMVAGAGIREVTWTPDGRSLLFINGDVGAGDIWQVDLHRAGEPRSFLQSNEAEDAPTVSPDGRWVAYSAAERGRPEIYVRSFPSGSTRYQVSVGDGAQPRWSRDGHELFYRGNGKVNAVEVDTRKGFRVTSRRPLFDDVYVHSTYRDVNYDVFPDGQHFLMHRMLSVQTQLVVVMNWVSQLGPGNSQR